LISAQTGDSILFLESVFSGPIFVSTQPYGSGGVVFGVGPPQKPPPRTLLPRELSSYLFSFIL